jgi:hypothetical protein
MARHVLVGAGHPVARDGDEHHGRVHRAQRLVSQPAPFEAARAHRLHHDVGPGHEVEEHRPGLLGAQVERDRPLAPADVQVHQRHAFDDGPRHLAHVVTRGRLDLDHIGAEVRQVRGDRSGAEHRALDDAHPGQGRRLALGHGPSPLACIRLDHRTVSDTSSDLAVASHTTLLPPDATPTPSADLRCRVAGCWARPLGVRAGHRTLRNDVERDKLLSPTA